MPAVRHTDRASIRPDRPASADKWHMDEVVIFIRRKKHWHWRAVDAKGGILEILLQSRRTAHAAKRFMRKSMKRWSASPGPLLRGRPPVAQWVEQYLRGFVLTRKTMRNDYRPFKNSAPSPAISVRHDQTAGIFRPKHP